MTPNTSSLFAGWATTYRWTTKGWVQTGSVRRGPMTMDQADKYAGFTRMTYATH